MPKFNFELPTPIESQTAFDKLKSFLSSENNFKKIDSKLTCTFDETAKKCLLNGSQFKASVLVKPVADKSNIQIEVEVPFALALFKGKIQEEIEKAFKKVLGT